jgi:hypothetical protein
MSINQNKTVEPKEIIESIKALSSLPKCKNCKESDLLLVELEPQTVELYREVAKKYNIESVACAICHTITKFMALPEDKQMEWLKEQSV